jgi:hypothetical protein
MNIRQANSSASLLLSSLMYGCAASTRRESTQFLQNAAE